MKKLLIATLGAALWIATGTQPVGSSLFTNIASEAGIRFRLDGEEAKTILQRARTGKAQIDTVTSENQRMLPPLLYDLTELQRHANRLFGFSAQKTLDLAQALYERHKLISYPRTDSRD